MPSTQDWPYLCLYLSFIVRGRYVTVLARFASFSQVMDEIAEHMQRPLADCTAVLLSAVKLDNEAFEYMEAAGCATVSVIN